jgi:sucrose phosphorylase
VLEVVYNIHGLCKGFFTVIMNNHRVRDLLIQLYGEQTGESVLENLNALLVSYRARLEPRPGGLSQRDSILITYADQVREAGVPALHSLAAFCQAHLSGIVNGVHILPFYPWSSDDGFSVMDYRQVAPEYGSWDDLSLGDGNFRLMFDAVINHISIQSSWFRGMLSGDPRYQDYFIVPPGDADLSKVVRPRALPLLTTFQTVSGEKQVWTTFSSDQADLNYKNPSVFLEIVDVLLLYIARGAEFIRLDAIAYLWKEPGTTCIHLPQTHAIVRLFRAVFDELAPHVSIITETNVPHAENVSYFGDGSDEAQLVYNFSLPPLVLYAFQTGSAQVLSEWARGLSLPSGEVTFFNFLASHDGIGLNPLRDILPHAEIEELIRRVKDRGGLVSLKSAADGSQQPYELNINYFDALNEPGQASMDTQIDRFVTAHAILLAMQGVPGIYFHSLFGSRGWPQGVSETGRNRTINRQKFTRAELEQVLSGASTRQARVFDRLSRLLKVRAELKAFHPFGAQEVISPASGVFGLLRTAPGGRERALCLHNVSDQYQRFSAQALASIGKPSQTWRDVISGRSVSMNDRFSLDPYESLWLV